MSQPLCYLLVLSMLMLNGCMVDPAPQSNPPSKEQVIRLLLLKEEGQLEVWIRDHKALTKWRAFPLRSKVDYPVGLFDVHSENGTFNIIFDNEFYKRKSALLSSPFEKESYPNLLSLLRDTEATDFLQLAGKDPNINILIVTNDIRKGGTFKACQHCPTWMTELHSQLQLELGDFTN